MKEDYPILKVCKQLEASPSGYYDWHKRRVSPGPRAVENQTLAKHIQRIHADSRKTYGSPRIMWPHDQSISPGAKSPRAG